MGRVSGWTLSNSYSLKTPPTSTIGNLTLCTHCQSSKMPTAHLFYIWKTSVPLSLSKVFLPRSFLRSETFLCPWQKQHVNHFKFTMLLEYKFGATQNYWIIKNKSSQTQRMLTEYNKSHIQGILKKNGKNKTLIILYCFSGKVISKTHASGFIRFPNTWKQQNLSACSRVVSNVFSHLETWWNPRTCFWNSTSNLVH